MRKKFIPMIQSRGVIEEIRKKNYAMVYIFSEIFLLLRLRFRKEADADNFAL